MSKTLTKRVAHEAGTLSSVLGMYVLTGHNAPAKCDVVGPHFEGSGAELRELGSAPRVNREARDAVREIARRKVNGARKVTAA